MFWIFIACLGPSSIFASAPSPSAFNVEWLSATAEPGITAGGKSTYAGAMPLGNGRTTALAWANASTGGVGIYLGSQDAMGSTTELFKLARFEVSATPNPFQEGSYFNQTLDVSSATFHLYFGGSNFSTYALHFKVYVDANADALRVSVTAGQGFPPFSLRVASFSTRPSVNWTHSPLFFCSESLTLPDVYVDPLPPTQSLGSVPLQKAKDKFRHAGGAARPLRRLHAPGSPLASPGAPTSFSFQPGSLLAYHRNSPEEGSTLATVLGQQGLLDLLPSTPDHWTDLQSGFVLDADDGPPLHREDSHTLVSSAPSSFFLLRATVLAVQTENPNDWFQDIAALIATTAPSSEARTLHEAWWSSWWARSYIAVNASNFPAVEGAHGVNPLSHTTSLDSGYLLSKMYALTRYTQAVQSRNTQWPIKFNGMAFIAAMGEEGEPDYRDWGACNWWQNTRLPYGSMLSAGDADSMRVVLDYYANAEVFLSQRTMRYWNHSGMWTTETHHLSGACEYPPPHLCAAASPQPSLKPAFLLQHTHTP